MRLRISSGIFSLIIVLSSPVALSSELPEPGEKCPKTGQTLIYKGKKYTCIKLGQKRLWDNGSKIITFQTWPKNPQVNATFLKKLTGAQWEIISNKVELNLFPGFDRKGGFWTSDSSHSCRLYVFERWGDAKGFAVNWVSSGFYNEYGEVITYIFQLRATIVDRSNDLDCTKRITRAYGGEKVGQ